MTIQASRIRHKAPQRWAWLMLASVFAVILPVVLVSAMDGIPAANGPATKPAATFPSPTRTADQKKQDDIDRVMEFFRLTQPDVYEQAKVLRETDQMKFEKLVMGTIPTVNKLEGIKRKNPRLFELSIQDMQLNYQSLRLAHDLKRTDLPETDRKQLMTQLGSVVAAEFDVQQQIRQLEVEDLRKKVMDLDNAVHTRQDDKGNVIKKRLEDLTERTPRLEW